MSTVLHADDAFGGGSTFGGHVHPSIAAAGDALVIVFADNLDDSPGKDVLLCTRSLDGGTSWSAPTQVGASRIRPGSIRESASNIFEIYPGTLNTLPGGQLLLTWQYIAMGDRENYSEGAMCYCLSDDAGVTWGAQHLIIDPAAPPDPESKLKLHLGAMRHSVMPWPDGRWLLPLRDNPPAGAEGRQANPRLHDPRTGALEDFQPLTPGSPEALPQVQNPIKQVIRTSNGELLAMSAGGEYTKPGETVASEAPLLHCDADGQWSVVPDFPAGNLPDGMALADWDDDGDREGRFLTPLSDGRVLATWGLAHHPKGVHYAVSGPSGASWPSAPVVVLPETDVIGR